MFSSVSGVLKDLFSTAWILAYWLPILLVVGIAAVCFLGFQGLGGAFDAWKEYGAAQQAVAGFGIAVGTSVLAVALQALKPVVGSIVTGRGWPGWLRSIGVQVQLVEKNRGNWKEANVRRSSLERYPQAGDVPLAPTALGNIMVTLEEHAQQAYGLQIGRLEALLRAAADDKTREGLEGDDARLTAWMNVTVLSAVSALLLVLGIAAAPERWRELAVGALVLALVARFSAMIMTAQGLIYAASLRALLATRLKALELIGLKKPDNLKDERAVWGWVNKWLYHSGKATLTLDTFRKEHPDAPATYFPPGNVMYQPSPTPEVDKGTTPKQRPRPWWLALLIGLAFPLRWAWRWLARKVRTGWAAKQVQKLQGAATRPAVLSSQKPPETTAPPAVSAQPPRASAGPQNSREPGVPAPPAQSVPVRVKFWAAPLAGLLQMLPVLALLLVGGVQVNGWAQARQKARNQPSFPAAVPAFKVVSQADLERCTLKPTPGKVWLTVREVAEGEHFQAKRLPIVQGWEGGQVLILSAPTQTLPPGTQATGYGVTVDAAGRVNLAESIPGLVVLQGEAGKPLVVQVGADDASKLAPWGSGHSRARLVLSPTGSSPQPTCMTPVPQGGSARPAWTAVHQATASVGRTPRELPYDAARRDSEVPTG